MDSELQSSVATGTSITKHIDNIIGQKTDVLLEIFFSRNKLPSSHYRNSANALRDGLDARENGELTHITKIRKRGKGGYYKDYFVVREKGKIVRWIKE